MKKLFLATLVLFANAAAQTPAATTPTPKPPADPKSVVATIGDTNITLSEFESAFRIAVGRVLNKQGLPYEDKLLPQFAPSRVDYLNQYAKQRAVIYLASSYITVNKSAIDDQVNKIKSGFKSDEELNTALLQSGYISLSELRDGLERQDIINQYNTELKQRFKFGDTAVNSYYALNKSKFTNSASACVKHILVKTKAEADAIMKELSNKGDFAKIAKAKSQDPGSAANGGDLGCIKPGDTVASFDNASFNGAINKLQLAQSEYGWHIIVVKSRTPSSLKPVNEVSDYIKEQLSQDAAQKYTDAQIAKLDLKTFPELVKITIPEPKK